MNVQLLRAILFLGIFLVAYLSILYNNQTRIKDKGSFNKKISNTLSSYLSHRDGYFSSVRIENFLKRTGNSFNLTTLGYILVKFFISIIFLVLFTFAKAYLLAVLFSILGFFVLDLLIVMRDKKDMKRVTFELRDIYDSLRMQLVAGTFLSDALRECYLIAQNKRFKKSLAILSAEISMTSDIAVSLDHFSERFKSDDINNFVLTLKQSLDTGKVESHLNDQSEQLRDMNLIELQNQSRHMEGEIDKIALLVFLGIFAVTIYFCLIQIPTNGLTGGFLGN